MADANMPAHRVCDKPTIIYSLTDPCTGDVRYVGKTIYTLAHRFSIHMSNARRGYSFHVYRWIRLLLDDGLEPIPGVIEIVPPGGDWEGAEKRWIAHYRSRVKLCNIVDGGGGAVGYSPTPEQRARISAAGKGRKRPPDAIAKTAAARRGCKHSDESRAKISAAVRSPEAAAKIKAARVGFKQKPEVIAMLAELRRGKKASEETKRKMSKAMMGKPGPMAGKTHSPDVKAKISAALKGRAGSNTGKPIPPDVKAKIAASMKAHRAAQRAATAAAASAQQPDLL